MAQRPHAKTHKTRQVAERQLAHGAVGLTVAKLGEAEAMVDAGFDDLFVAYPLVGELKLRRLVALLDRARIRFEVDTLEGAEAASSFLGSAGRRVDVVVSSTAVPAGPAPSHARGGRRPGRTSRGAARASSSSGS